MAVDAAPLQVDEVVRALTLRKQCTLVHIATGTEVDIYEGTDDEDEPWRIRYSHYEILDKACLQEALALGFELCSHVCRSDTRFELYRNCMGIAAAAMKGLRLARLLPGVPADAWLWVTVYEYDDRDEPPTPPTPWPPAGT